MRCKRTGRNESSTLCIRTLQFSLVSLAFVFFYRDLLANFRVLHPGLPRNMGWVFRFRARKDFRSSSHDCTGCFAYRPGYFVDDAFTVALVLLPRRFWVSCHSLASTVHHGMI